LPLRRGAPKGNKNRLKHGRFTAEAHAARTQRRQLVRKARAAISEAKGLIRELSAVEPVHEK
jgi:hypothetical protein